MFSHRARGLVDFLAAALCLWAAAYHTPVGAGVRGVGGRLLGVKSSAQPLLAYYSGGVYSAHEVKTPLEPPMPAQLAAASAELSRSEGLGYGVWAVWSQLSFEQRRSFAASGLDSATLLDPLSGPDQMTRLVGDASRKWGSEEVAVLSLFGGQEPARYASERARAEGSGLTLDELARHLPPGFDEQVGLASQAMALGTAYALSWPVPAWAKVTSPFGMRQHPLLGGRRMHTGVDLGVPTGTLVRAVERGVVRRASEDHVNGKVLVVDHGRGVTTAYCHNSALLVVPGQQVEKGQIIARSGSTGRSTGPHLHYQLELGGMPMDPFLFKQLLTNAPERVGVKGRDESDAQSLADATEL
ncbi:MAG: M23 family metallopeptidase [Myxococcota bacterium]